MKCEWRAMDTTDRRYTSFRKGRGVVFFFLLMLKMVEALKLAVDHEDVILSGWVWFGGVSGFWAARRGPQILKGAHTHIHIAGPFKKNYASQLHHWNWFKRPQGPRLYLTLPLDAPLFPPF
ncbi:hypothetical protein F4809DRAFT_106283 [Biscogniauxia mediterranea]|nr:hypothetical protein F4809DRAFT_106283 [Biscogniauxia mediterranea]